MSLTNKYTDKPTTELLDKYGAFFAFSDEQFNKAKKENTEYVSLGLGLIVPKENADHVHAGLFKINVDGAKEVLKNNKREDIIEYELNNHECYYTGDIEDACDALKVYDITKAEIMGVFVKKSAHHICDY